MSQPTERLVLHVDDNSATRQMVSEILEDRGYEVIEAHNGFEALQLLLERRVDLVLTDLQMPGMDGHALIDHIGRLHPGLPIVVVAAPGIAGEVLLSLMRKAQGYLAKPFTQHALLSVVHDTLQQAARKVGIEVISVTAAWIELRFPNHEAYIARIREFFDSLEIGVDTSERGNLLYVFTELAQNAIEHGNRHDPNTFVTLSWYRFPGMRVFRVRDEGAGFNPDDLSHAIGFKADADPREIMRRRSARGMRPGGLGIASASRFADELLYNERGNEVIMIKQVKEI